MAIGNINPYNDPYSYPSVQTGATFKPVSSEEEKSKAGNPFGSSYIPSFEPQIGGGQKITPVSQPKVQPRKTQAQQHQEAAQGLLAGGFKGLFAGISRITEAKENPELAALMEARNEYAQYNGGTSFQSVVANWSANGGAPVYGKDEHSVDVTLNDLYKYLDN